MLSTFGVMFASQPEVAAAELLRVTRPAGRIGLANWTPGGFVGQMFRIVGGYVPPPAGLPSPLEWGDRSRVHELPGRTTQRGCGAGALRIPSEYLEVVAVRSA